MQTYLKKKKINFQAISICNSKLLVVCYFLMLFTFVIVDFTESLHKNFIISMIKYNYKFGFLFLSPKKY